MNCKAILYSLNVKLLLSSNLISAENEDTSNLLVNLEAPLVYGFQMHDIL